MPLPWTLAGLSLCLAALPGPAPQTGLKAQAPLKPQDLTLEQLYRATPYAGQSAQGAAFSWDGRFLAYLWNPYGERGSDLYLHDTTTGQTRRVTSLEVMKAYDTPEVLARFQKKADQQDRERTEAQAQMEAQAAYLAGAAVDLDRWDRAALDALKQEAAARKAKQEAEKKAKAEAAPKGADATGKPEEAKKEAKPEKEKELWEWRDELKKKREKDKLKPGDLYPGVSALQWAHKSHELVFQYRGDLFRCWAAEGRVERLTSTDRAERIVGYMAGDEGYLYQDGNSVVRVAFASGRQVQVNRELFNPDDAEKKFVLRGTALSEDGQWMALVAHGEEVKEGAPAAPAQPGRKVQIMDYSKRFAESKTVNREVSDDKRKVPATALYIRRVGETPTPQPEPVFTHPGGDVWFEMTSVVWAQDGSRYAFATWEREQELLRIYLGSASETAKPEVVLERKGQVGHEVITTLAPRFTPDGKTLVVVLDEEGWRQPFALDVATRVLRPVVKGAFEAHTLLGFTPDSRSLFLVSNKLDPAAMTTFKLDLASGTMQPLGTAGDYHRGAVVSENGEKAAFNAGNWARRPELQVVAVASGQARVLTESHDKAWDRVNVLRPERFSFKNRHGDTVEGYLFKPKGWKPSDRRPGVVYVYGGPLGNRRTVEVDSFQPTAYMFGMYMAARHGYVTVAVDPRGQSNAGRRFAGANWEQPGQPQTEDLEDLVKHLSRGHGVDPERLGLTGWSFGGFQTQYTMYTKPDLFACGIAGAGPTEWENYNSWYSGRTIGKVDRAKPVLRKHSLLPLAKGLRKPLLLVHGMADPNVLYQDTVNVYRALLESGKESLVDLFLDPEGQHSLGGAVMAKGWHKKYEAFFLQHLGKAR